MTPLHKVYVILVLSTAQLAAVFWILRPVKPGADDARRQRNDRNLAIVATIITAAIVCLLFSQ